MSLPLPSLSSDNSGLQTPDSAPFSARVLRLWDEATLFVEKGFRHLRAEASKPLPRGAEGLRRSRELWRLFLLSLNAIAAIQEGRAAALKAAEEPADDADGHFSDEFARRLQREFAEIVAQADAENEAGDEPDNSVIIDADPVCDRPCSSVSVRASPSNP